jgi:Fe-S-cluster containining protein
MSGRSLPVLNPAPFRKYPTKLAEQEFDDDRLVCRSCLSGVCCSSEDPIYLTSFDVFRLAAFFDLTPAQFLLRFTQERFDGEDSESERRPWIEDPDSSKVTYLRRRGSTPKSPCIFLKYTREEDGTPRRVCSVHDARPLSCREFYFHHCKTRQTGELAALLAEGYEKVRDGEITEEMADTHLARLGARDSSSARASEAMEYAFWFEMKRVLNMERANTEGGLCYDASRYQDPIDEKLNRVLSAKYLRFEEDYGPEPVAEQLMPYTSGLSFAGSPERARIMRLLRTRPSGGLYAPGDYPFNFGVRTMVPGVGHAEVFHPIPDAEIEAFLDGVPPAAVFPDHEAPEVSAVTRRDVCASVLKGVNHLIRFSSYLAAVGNVLEGEPEGVLELELLSTISGWWAGPDPLAIFNTYLEPVKLHLAAACVGLLEEEADSAKKPAEFFALHRRLCAVEAAAVGLPEGLRGRFDAVRDVVTRNLRKERLGDYVELRNRVAARQAAGKRLTAQGAWASWERSARDISYAARAGFGGPALSDYYLRSIAELEGIPFKKSYAMSLYRVVVSLMRGMISDDRAVPAAGPDRDAAARLASYGSRLFGWMDERWGAENLDVETLAGFAACVGEGRGASRDCDRHFGIIVRRLLVTQMSDGSWGTDPLPPDAGMVQADYLRRLYRVTGACVEGLYPGWRLRTTASPAGGGR